MTVSEEFTNWFARNAYRFGYQDADVDEAKHILLWECKDGWIVGYTTSRVLRGPHVGKFVTVAYKPIGKGARSGTADLHQMVYERAFTNRRPPSLARSRCTTGMPNPRLAPAEKHRRTVHDDRA